MLDDEITPNKLAEAIGAHPVSLRRRLSEGTGPASRMTVDTYNQPVRLIRHDDVTTWLTSLRRTPHATRWKDNWQAWLRTHREASPK